MKKIIFSALLMINLFVVPLDAQYPDLPNGITVKYTFVDYYSPLMNESPLKTDELDVAVEFGYVRNINKFLNIAVPLKIGYFSLPEDENNLGREELVSSLDALMQLHLFKKGRPLVPYLFGGAGGVLEKNNELTIQFPVGVGLNVRIADNIYLQGQTEYREALENKGLRDAWHHSVGLLFLTGKVEQPPADTDGDGVSDLEDDCPLIAGLAQFNGCPDTDNDGIPDKDDACPNEPGAAEFEGCPDTDNDGIPDKDDACPKRPGKVATQGCPDTDGDGIIDDKDKCPDEPGIAEFDGCPPPPPDTDGDGITDADDDCPTKAGLARFNGCPDTDGDGLKDSDDKCPTVAGPVSNNGCPEIKKEDKEKLEFATQAVEFNTGKASLKSESYPILDEIAGLMKKYPDYSLRIGGHTDSQGSSGFNMTLSENRAKTCFEYFMSKGISASRMSFAGFGEEKPIADNRYAAGRAKNRRVEFDMYLPE